MSIGYNKSSTEREFVRKYENMRGVDFSEVQRKASNQRYGYLENMYVDYAAGGSAVESIPGFRVLKSTGKKIHSIFSHRLGDGNEYIFVHAGTNLYRFRSDMRDSISSSWTLVGKTLNDAESHAISYGDYLLILDGNKINVVYQEELLGTLGENVPVYVPSVSVGGVADEDINLLSQSCTSQYHIKSFDDVSHASPGLTYTVVKDGEEYCEVTYCHCV